MCAPPEKEAQLYRRVSLVGAMENSAEVPAGQRAGRDRKGKGQKGTFKQRGELAEMRFMLKAAGLGFGVAKPWGDSERYDFVLDSGKGFLRIQVKSTCGPQPKLCGEREGKPKQGVHHGADRLPGCLYCRRGRLVRDPNRGFCPPQSAEVLPLSV